MKKMLRNKKGFSLIELLIVIAIMGVLAVIAFSMFSGVVANSRKKADNTQAGNIQKAIVAYMVDTGDTDLSELTYKTSKITESTKWDTLVLMLQSEQTVNKEKYKPFLNPQKSTSPSTVEFRTQWSGHHGYKITVTEANSNAIVIPATTETDNKIEIIKETK